jgi:hypothetical protein
MLPDRKRKPRVILPARKYKLPAQRWESTSKWHAALLTLMGGFMKEPSITNEEVEIILLEVSKGLAAGIEKAFRREH